MNPTTNKYLLMLPHLKKHAFPSSPCPTSPYSLPSADPLYTHSRDLFPSPLNCPHHHHFPHWPSVQHSVRRCSILLQCQQRAIEDVMCIFFIWLKNKVTVVHSKPYKNIRLISWELIFMIP